MKSQDILRMMPSDFYGKFVTKALLYSEHLRDGSATEGYGKGIGPDSVYELDQLHFRHRCIYLASLYDKYYPPIPPIKYYTLTYYVDGGEPEYVYKGYEEETTVQLESPEDLGINLPEGYTFNDWELNGQIITEIIMDSDKLIIGNLLAEKRNLLTDTFTFSNWSVEALTGFVTVSDKVTESDGSTSLDVTITNWTGAAMAQITKNQNIYIEAGKTYTLSANFMDKVDFCEAQASITNGGITILNTWIDGVSQDTATNIVDLPSDGNFYRIGFTFTVDTTNNKTFISLIAPTIAAQFKINKIQLEEGNKQTPYSLNSSE